MAATAEEVITSDNDRAELVEYLGNLLAFARRQPAVTAKFTSDRPTDYDRAHQRIDSALDDILSL